MPAAKLFVGITGNDFLWLLKAMGRDEKQVMQAVIDLPRERLLGIINAQKEKEQTKAKYVAPEPVIKPNQIKDREIDDTSINQNPGMEIPVEEDIPYYKKTLIEDSIQKMNDILTTFPDGFIKLYEDWKALKTESHAVSESILEKEARLANRKIELEKIKSFKNYSAYYNESLHFNMEKLPVVIMDTIQLAYYAYNFANIPPSTVAEAIAAAGYDFADFLDTDSLKSYLNKKWEIQVEISQLELEIKNARNRKSDIASANIGNHFSGDTLQSLENKMERKYPGMKARYEKYLNANGGYFMGSTP